MPGRRLLSVEGDRELARLARQFRQRGDGRELDRELRRELAAVGDSTVRAVRSAIRAIPSKGQNARRGRPSLRSQMARAAESKVRTTRRPGVIVWVNPRRMPLGRRSLPAFMEGAPPHQRWRHPTFGRSPWQTQRPHPYFAQAVRPAAADAERAGRRTLGNFADRIENS